MRTAIILCAVLALSGCSAGIQRAADAYDDSLVAAEVWVCRGASIGSIVRAYGRDDATWNAWKTLCGYDGVNVPRPVPSD